MTPKQERFYVYGLVDPRNGETFYVGKGSGSRAKVHERATIRGQEKNGAKAERIAAIHSSGERVSISVIADNLTEAEAFRQERQLIQRDRLTLTNIAGGCVSQLESSKAHARAMLSRIKPFDEWRAERRPNSSEISMYDGVVRAFQRIAEDGFERVIRLGRLA